MKETFERAHRFIESVIGSRDCAVLGCDIDSHGNIHLYSSVRLDGYSQTGEIYEKTIRPDEMTDNQRNALNRYLIVGPCVRETNLKGSDEIYTRDLEASLFGIGSHKRYIFVPTENAITRELFDSDESYEMFREFMRENPGDSVLVHEYAHLVPPEIRRKMAKRFGLGKRDKNFSRKVQEETFARCTEMLYLEKNYPGIAKKRRERFTTEIDEGEKRSADGGRDPHPPASKLYFAVDKNQDLKDFVLSLYRNTP